MKRLVPDLKRIVDSESKKITANVRDEGKRHVWNLMHGAHLVTGGETTNYYRECRRNAERFIERHLKKIAES